MGYSTRSQGLPAFKSKMAARFWHVRIPQNNSAFLEIFTQFRDLPKAVKYSDVLLLHSCKIPTFLREDEVNAVVMMKTWNVVA